MIAFLATASLGAVWSSCPPEFGTRAVIDRFGQIEPTVLFVVDGYTFNGRTFDLRPEHDALRAGLPTVTTLVQVPSVFAGQAPEHGLACEELLATTEPLHFERVPFDHPLYVRRAHDGAPTSFHVGVPVGPPKESIKRLADEGLLGSDMSFAHCCSSTAEEFRLLADHGARAMSCPSVDAALNLGVSPPARMRENGLAPCFAADAVTSASGDLFETLAPGRPSGHRRVFRELRQRGLGHGRRQVREAERRTRRHGRGRYPRRSRPYTRATVGRERLRRRRR
ncbi:hypothetical protein ACFV23_02125 [Streptomyces sp. NPDC059627]